MTDKQVEAVAKALCKSGKFETGEGTCALICMGQLGDARRGGCSYRGQVHGKLAEQIVQAIEAAK
jgi:hypothetical protein